MPSAWIEKRPAKTGVRFLVKYALGGRESSRRFAGSFRTRAAALARKRWVDGELAAMRVPDVRLLAPPAPVRTLAVVAESWRVSRVDVAAGTAATHRVNLARILPRLGKRPIDDLTAADVAGLVSDLAAGGMARESIRKTRATLAMVLDFASVEPNPARDRMVKLPREEKAEVDPPIRAHVEAVHRLLASAYRLPLLVLDGTGMRVKELEGLTWGDVDEPDGRWRVSQAVAKTGRARWVPVPPALFAAVVELCPRDDRVHDRRVFQGVTDSRLRTAIARACRAAGVPHFSPHDLRHRRATLWHLAGEPVVQAAAWLGHSPHEHLKTYAHATLTDRSELDYAQLTSERRVERARTVPPRVPSREAESRD